MTSTAVQRAKAEAIFAAVNAGQTVFTRNGDIWMIVGPDADIHPGAHVSVTKANGELVPVVVDEVGGRREKRGVAYAVATFHKAPKPQPAQATTERTYDAVRPGWFGAGRRYHDTPGATHYDSDGTGDYTTQLWDES